MKGWGVIVRADDSVAIVPIEKGNTYDAIKNAVDDAWFDCVSLEVDGTRIDMWVDDEGLLKRLPLNKFATQMHATRVGVEHACIVGPAFFTGGPDREGETNPLTDDELNFLVKTLVAKTQEDYTGPHFSWKGATWD